MFRYKGFVVFYSEYLKVWLVSFDYDNTKRYRSIGQAKRAITLWHKKQAA